MTQADILIELRRMMFFYKAQTKSKYTKQIAAQLEDLVKRIENTLVAEIGRCAVYGSSLIGVDGQVLIFKKFSPIYAIEGDSLTITWNIKEINKS